jgi:cysteine protease ATG4
MNNAIKFSNKNNFIIKQLNINSSTLEQINIKDFFILFNKKYTNKEKQKIIYNFNKIIYFCYRKNTYPMSSRIRVGISRDSGWGCMVRCGQMIMARAIYKYLKSKKYSSEKAVSETIKLFLDAPYLEKNIPLIISCLLSYQDINQNVNNNFKILPPFSIQMHCLLGKYYNKYAGEWFSDVNLCQNYRDINDMFQIFPELKIFSFVSDFKLYEVLDKCFSLVNKDNNSKKKLKIINCNSNQYIMEKCGLIFISARLGLNKVTDEYYSSLKKVFECKECIGIIGGEPSLAHYFIGYNDKGNLIYLDPHITRDAVYELNDDTITNDYLVKSLHEISIDDMSTGLSFGFLFRNSDEFEDLIKFVEDYCKTQFPCFGLIRKNIEIDLDKYENLFNDEDDF